MIVEQVQQHFAAAPEYKVSKLDDSTAQLVGGHAGIYVTQTLLVGAGFYTMTNGNDRLGLTYGGGVVAWEPWSTSRLSLNTRGLLGWGRGTVSDTVTLTSRDRRGLTLSTREATRWLSSDLFVAEPQVEALVGLTRHMKLGIGGGYRFAAADRVDNDRFSGATGTISLRFGSAN